MRLKTKGQLAVRAMVDLGMRQNKGPVTLAGIGQRQAISLSYLEQLFSGLRRHSLVESTRGPGGGYCLRKAAADISVADIIFAVDEPLDAAPDDKPGNSDNDQRCMTREVWTNLSRRMIDYLDSVSLADLVAEQKANMARPVPTRTAPLRASTGHVGSAVVDGAAA